MTGAVLNARPPRASDLARTAREAITLAALGHAVALVYRDSAQRDELAALLRDDLAGFKRDGAWRPWRHRPLRLDVGLGSIDGFEASDVVLSGWPGVVVMTSDADGDLSADLAQRWREAVRLTGRRAVAWPEERPA